MKKKLFCYFLAASLIVGGIVPRCSVFAEQNEEKPPELEEVEQENKKQAEFDTENTVQTEEEEVQSDTGDEQEDFSVKSSDKFSVEAALDERGGTKESTNEVIIYHTNDIHGAFSEEEGGSVGLAKAATLKKETENALLVDAGDCTQGLPLVSLSKGTSAIELMNTAGYDLMAAGNHEFDYGLEQLFSNVSLAEFPVLAANVYRDGNPLFLDKTAAENNGENAVLDVGEKKIGFFGLLTVGTQTSTNPDAVSQLEFRDEVETAKAQIDALEEQDVDAIVAVCHMGDEPVVDCTSDMLANALTGEYQGKLDLIIDGHSHTKENTVENEVLIVQTGSGMTELGKVTLSFEEDGEVQAVEEPLYEEDLSEIEPDAQVLRKIQEIQEGQEPVLAQKVSDTDTSLWGGWVNDLVEVRMYETNLGDLSADAYAWAAETYLAKQGKETKYIFGVINGGGVRESIPAGEITVGNLVTVFPFSNTLMVKKITPAILYQVMENSVSYQTGQEQGTGTLLGGASGGYLQISGFQVSYNPSAGAGEKVTSIQVPDETGNDTVTLSKDDTQTEIMLVSNNFIMTGGNEYTMLGELPLEAEIGGELEAVESYLTEVFDQGVIGAYPVQGGRIQIEEDASPEEYQAHIRVTDTQGNLIPNQEMSYYIDSDRGHNGTTDENGLLTVTLPRGPHAVKLAKDQAEVYLNNYSGNGLQAESSALPNLIYKDDGSCAPLESYKITYVLNGGVNHKGNPESFRENDDKIVLKEPSRKGYQFQGWYLDKKFKSPCDEIASGTKEDITVYAKWRKDNLEPNDSWKTAVKLRVPSKTESYISDSEDVDYYRFTLREEEKISIRLTQPNDKDMCCDVALYNGDYDVIKKSQMNLDQSIVQNLKKGTYYITVSSLNGGFSSQPYVLRLSKIANTGLDFSEQNLLTQSLHPDSAVAFDLGGGLNSGGHLMMSTAYFSRWGGPLTEEQNPYPEYSLVETQEGGYQFQPSEDEVEILIDQTPVYHLQDAIWLPQREDALDNDYVKSAIYTYGGVDAYYLEAYEFRNEREAAIYVPELTDEELGQYSAGGHCITLVGWDDNYPKENFTPATPPGDGAFIFKNSWGEEAGENGYYYLSYYSHNLLANPGAVYFMEEGADNYNTIYQYDTFGVVNTIQSEQPLYMANAFTANGKENLRAVSFSTMTENLDYEIYVELGKERQRVASGSTRYAGYKTVRLQNEIALKQGQEFSIIIKFSKESGFFEIPIEYPVEGYSAKAESKEGISWISEDGENWEDLYSFKANPCIKAFTYNEELDGTLAEGVDSSINININGDSVSDCPRQIGGFSLGERGETESKSQRMTEDGRALGAKIVEHQTEVASEEAPITELPEQFDLRQIGAVTPIRNQYDMGSCWTFAAMGSAESVLMRNENACYTYPMDVQIQGEDTILLTDENSTVTYEALAELSTDIAATDVITWELSGDLDSVEQGAVPLRSASGQQISLFTAKKAGMITLTAVSAADQNRTDTIMVKIQDERTKVTPTAKPEISSSAIPTQKPGVTGTVTNNSNDVNTTKADKADGAKTADETPIGQWSALTILSVMAAVVVLFRRKKSEK